MKAQKGPMLLPMISARGNMSARDLPSSGRGGQDSARSRGGDATKFNKLKGVLVNNLLKYYHKQTKRQGNEQVYARAVEEVERILQTGKLQEKHLKELQQRFASGMGISEGGKVVPRPPTTQQQQLGTAQSKGSDDGAIGHRNAVGDTDEASATDGMFTANGSPSKRQVPFSLHVVEPCSKKKAVTLLLPCFIRRLACVDVVGCCWCVLLLCVLLRIVCCSCVGKLTGAGGVRTDGSERSTSGV